MSAILSRLENHSEMEETLVDLQRTCTNILAALTTCMANDLKYSFADKEVWCNRYWAGVKSKTSVKTLVVT